MERDTTTSTREALERGERRGSRLRVAGVIAGITALALGIAAAVGYFLVPPWLATVPADPVTTTMRIAVTAENEPGVGRPASASVEVSAGWTPIGVGPFLPTDVATLVSPDGAYRAQLEITDASADTEPTPGASTDHLDGLAAAVWSHESLDSGCSVRYTTVHDGSDAVTVAVVTPPPGDGDADARLVLLGSVAATTADLYRTVTADLVISARFGEADTGTGSGTDTGTGTSSPTPGVAP